MDSPQDRKPFLVEMKRLSTALSTELTDQRVTVYRDALVDLPIDSVICLSVGSPLLAFDPQGAALSGPAHPARICPAASGGHA